MCHQLCIYCIFSFIFFHNCFKGTKKTISVILNTHTHQSVGLEKAYSKATTKTCVAAPNHKGLCLYEKTKQRCFHPFHSVWSFFSPTYPLSYSDAHLYHYCLFSPLLLVSFLSLPETDEITALISFQLWGFQGIWETFQCRAEEPLAQPCNPQQLRSINLWH